jgi:hypothetical protein
MTRPAFAAALVLAPCAALAEPGDVPWYVQNHAERRAKLEWCVQDAARQSTRECRNARAAGAVELMTPGHKWSRPPQSRQPPRPVAPKPAAPVGKGPLRAA